MVQHRQCVLHNTLINLWSLVQYFVQPALLHYIFFPLNRQYWVGNLILAQYLRLELHTDTIQYQKCLKYKALALKIKNRNTTFGAPWKDEVRGVDGLKILPSVWFNLESK